MFQVELPLTAIFQARTVGRIAALVLDRRSSPAASALAPIQPEGSLPPLFLCEGIGIYYPLIRHLGREQPVYALVTEIAEDYPRVEDLAASYIAEVRAVQPEGPYFLGGLSFGGIVAFEMAQQLLRIRPGGRAAGPVRHADALGLHAEAAPQEVGRPSGQLAPVRSALRPGEARAAGEATSGGSSVGACAAPRSPRREILADEDRLRHLLGRDRGPV